jgi:Na+/H+-translocating membrane pyrophosphatase
MSWFESPARRSAVLTGALEFLRSQSVIIIVVVVVVVVIIIIIIIIIIMPHKFRVF